MNDERAPVSFSVAKPVNPKTRHPFSGEPLQEDPVAEKLAVETLNSGTQVSYTPANPYKLVLDDLLRRRNEIDRAIALIESLL